MKNCAVVLVKDLMCKIKKLSGNIKSHDFQNDSSTFHDYLNRPFSHSGKESESNDVMIQFEEFSNMHNSYRTSNAT